MSFTSTKTCRYCAETIAAGAKVCPRCRQWQTLWSLRNPAVQVLFLSGVTCALGIVLLVWLQRTFDPGPDFSLFRNSLTVVESKDFFYTDDKRLRLRTLVVLTNQSALSWKNIELEARYFDKENKYIDTKIYMTGDVILCHDELALSTELFPCHPQSDYISHKIFVRAARNACAIP